MAESSPRFYVTAGATEIILVGPSIPPDFHETVFQSGLQNVQWVFSPLGRAVQLNDGARRGSASFLWFLHADSRLDELAIKRLYRSLDSSSDSLLYFNLKFQSDGPALVRLNALGAWVRSHALGLPFGDQGFCLRSDLFRLIGGFNESCAYGEDHLFVWAARRLGIRARCVGGTISTSARKYRKNGWLRTTLIHWFRTARQAIPESLTLFQARPPSQRV